MAGGLAMARDFSIACQVSEKGFFKKQQYVDTTIRLHSCERGSKVLEYSTRCVPQKSGKGQQQVGGKGSVRLALAGMKLKVHKNLVASAAYSKTKEEGRRATYFKFSSDADLHSFLGEMSHYPEVFRRFRDYYDVGEKIGEGHTCKVYRAWSKITQEQVAIKLSTKSSDSHREMHNELRILRYLKSEHSSLPQLKDYFYDSKGNIALVLEFLDISLGEYVNAEGTLPEPVAKRLFEGVLDCVSFLHGRGLAHRDLKVENLMFAKAAAGKQAVKKKERRMSRVFGLIRSNSRRRSSAEDEAAAARSALGETEAASRPEALPELKVIDFGFGKIRGSSNSWKASTPCGTTRYLAPEMVEGRMYSQAVDLWSCGCILHFMLFGKLPFSKIQVQQGDVSEPRLGGDKISLAAKDLLSKLLSAANKRLTASESLKHPWFTGELDAVEESEEDELPLSRVSLSPGPDLAKMLSRMREEDDKLEENLEPAQADGEDNSLSRPSPISALNFGGDSPFKSRQLSILRMHLEEQLNGAAANGSEQEEEDEEYEEEEGDEEEEQENS
ncbi:serine/threonine protein kinase [Chloropicon primus]|uniref:Serine/threonine protein kinase n=1 Tax=Chloropicon primus TaxID=1764295 RepID=A0A5B8MLE2_9CHLO|nr:serine/threonine protein kinase [Chloropicon primus]UPR00507.1 serine/threonine protein kinase [Chloropicon primus]|eukprot:QDZ21293.1 serine/threonine protein kinase [Chloropicon primus]